MIKYTPQYLQKLQSLIRENNFTLRNEKGNFKSGYCLFKDTRVIVVNQFATLESRINSLMDILKELNETEGLNDAAREELGRIEKIRQKKPARQAP